MIATIMAEDAFDIGDRLHEISAPTWSLVGAATASTRPICFRKTANGIPNAHLILYENRAHGGTVADRRFGSDVVAFLTTERAYP